MRGRMDPLGDIPSGSDSDSDDDEGAGAGAAPVGPAPAPGGIRKEVDYAALQKAGYSGCVAVKMRRGCDSRGTWGGDGVGVFERSRFYDVTSSLIRPLHALVRAV